jgi:hypothetical protein
LLYFGVIASASEANPRFSIANRRMDRFVGFAFVAGNDIAEPPHQHPQP